MPIEISHKLLLISFKHQEPEIYEISLDEFEEVILEVPPGYNKVSLIRKPVPCAPKLYVLHYTNIVYVLCLLLYVFFFVGNKVTVDHSKDDIIPFIKEKDRIEFYPSIAMNHVREKGKPRLKLTYIIFKETYVYDSLLLIYPFLALINFTESLGGIRHFFTAVAMDGN